MKAPEKIYLERILCSNEVYDNWKSQKTISDDIEYTRTDTFIEKACQFIKEHHHEFSFWNTEEYELGFSTQKFIEDFKNYMKGE